MKVISIPYGDASWREVERRGGCVYDLGDRSQKSDLDDAFEFSGSRACECGRADHRRIGRQFLQVFDDRERLGEVDPFFDFEHGKLGEWIPFQILGCCCFSRRSTITSSMRSSAPPADFSAR
jgi:hypothetical protein